MKMMVRWTMVLCLALAVSPTANAGSASANKPVSTSEEIQGMIDALGPEGGTVNLETGTYLIRSAIRLASNTTIQGQGMGKTILFKADNASGPVFLNKRYDERKYRLAGDHDITIKDLTIDANCANNHPTSIAIYLANCYNYRIESVHIKNARSRGIYTNPNHAAAERGIAYRNYIINNIVEGTTEDERPGVNYGHGIYVSAWDNDNILIKGNICRNNAGAGIHLEDRVEYITVEYNTVHHNAIGIWVNCTRNSIIRFNLIEDNGRGILMDGGFTANNLIYGNQISRSGREGILLGTPGSKDSHPSYCMIVNNMVKNNGQYKREGATGISVRFSNNTIAFNTCIDDQVGKTQDYGIVVYSNNNTVIGNYLKYNKKADASIPEGNTFIPYGSLVDMNNLKSFLYGTEE